MLSLASSTLSFTAPRSVPAPTMQEAAPFDATTYMKAQPGVTAPLGYFDPAGFMAADDVTEGKARFYREVEIKHARLAMLAAVGFPLAEQFHPLFNSDDAPSYLAFQQTPLQTFWPAVVMAISVLETFSVFTFENPVGGEPWAISKDHAAGDLGFDPLGLKPTNAAELAELQTKELNNGRLAMFGSIGMLTGSYITGKGPIEVMYSGDVVVF